MIFKKELASLLFLIICATISNSRADDTGGTGGSPKAACLDGSDYVHTPEGPKLISRLSIGDRVAIDSIGDQQAPKFDTVISFLHRDPEKTANGFTFTTTSSNNGSLTLSEEHLIFTAPNMKAVLAKNVKLGDRLYVMIDNRLEEAVIEKIDRNRQLKGLYSPLTRSGVILVNNVLVSCYSQIEDHPLMHHVTQWLMPFGFSERLFGPTGVLANKDRLHWVGGDLLWYARRWFLYQSS